MLAKPYGTICSLAKACEVLEPRWTLLILNEMWSGYSRFNDIRRAVGNISPGVLSKRLSEMEKAGLVEKIEDRAKGTVEYLRTKKAIELETAMNELAVWAQRNIEADIALAESDASHMMWSYSKSLRTSLFPHRRIVLRFHFTDETGPFSTYWLIAEPGSSPEVCIIVPDFDVDLYVETTKVALNALFLGRSTIDRELDAGRLFVTGDARLKQTMHQWFPRSAYAEVEGIKQLPNENGI